MRYGEKIGNLCSSARVVHKTAKQVIQVIREFKKLRRQLQRKRRIKIELCVKLSLLRLFRVDHVLQNWRTALSLPWHEWFS